MERGIVSFIVVVFVIAIAGFAINWFENEPEFIFKDANIYEYNEFMTSGEASELGLEGGFGNYFKYSGDFNIEIDYLKLEDILKYEITVELINTSASNILIYSETITEPSTLTIVSQFPQTDFFDDDYEEAILIIKVTYLDRTTRIINVDEDFF